VRENHGVFLGKIFALVFERGSRVRGFVTGSETSAVYKLHEYTMHKSSKDEESRLEKRNIA